MIKIISGSSVPGGSTIALVNLCNQFNKRGHACIFYGPDRWHLDKCRAEGIAAFKPEYGDTVIISGIKLFSLTELTRIEEKIRKQREKSRLTPLKDMYLKTMPGPKKIAGVKFILTCLNREVSNLKNLKWKIFEKVHYADFSQAKFHNIARSHFICPNFGNALIASDAKPDKTAGVIGTIKSENMIVESVEKAIHDGMGTVTLFGYLADPVYFYGRIEPLTKKYPGRIRYAGFLDDRQNMYDSISDVYRSVSKPWSLVRRECRLTGTRYHGPEPCSDESMSDDQIFAIWKDQLGL